jgi:hypothetical protein
VDLAPCGRRRTEWKLGLHPVASVVGVLEDRRTHVLEIDAIEKFDGLAAVARKGGEVAAAAGARRGVSGCHWCSRPPNG